jgi:phospholipase C
VTETWNLAAHAGAPYDFSVYGPNGFFRGFKGAWTLDSAQIDVRATYGDDGREITLELSNRSSASARVSILDGYTSRRTRVSLGPGEANSRHWAVASVWGWYDFVITVDEDPRFEYQLAGHLETGEDSISDPAMGGIV